MASPKAPASPGNVISIKTHWVLIVEDDPEFRSLLAGAMSVMGFRVLEAGAAPAALTKLRNQKFDLLLVDMQLGRGTGEEVIEAVRRDPKDVNHDTPAIVISGFLDAGLIERIGRKVSSVLVKPFKVQDLRARVTAALGAAGAPKESRKNAVG